MTRREQLRQKTAEVSERQRRLEARLQAASGARPQPGDLLVGLSPESPELQWAVLEAEDHELAMVPADATPFLGTREVSALELNTGCPLTLHCGHLVRVDSSVAESWVRSGTISQQDARAAREKVAAIRAGSLDTDPVAVETENNSEYQSWIRDTVEPAFELLNRKSVRIRDVQKARQPAGTASAWKLAASVLLALAIGFAGGLTWRQAPTGARDGNVVDLPILPLSPIVRTRGEGEAAIRTLQLDSDTGSFAVWLVVHGEPAPSYRAELYAERRMLWSADHLEARQIEGRRYVSFMLPAAQARPGVNELRLLAGADAAESAHVYRFELEFSPGH